MSSNRRRDVEDGRSAVVEEAVRKHHDDDVLVHQPAQTGVDAIAAAAAVAEDLGPAPGAVHLPAAGAETDWRA
jgi:hypothetical protein